MVLGIPLVMTADADPFQGEEQLRLLLEEVCFVQIWEDVRKMCGIQLS